MMRAALVAASAVACGALAASVIHVVISGALSWTAALLLGAAGVAVVVATAVIGAQETRP